MLAAGALAGAGLLSLPLTIAASMAGIFASDTFCFLLGRLAGHHLVRWFPRWHSRLGIVFRLMERYDEKLIVGFQFIPGLCTVAPVVFGMSGISAPRFMLLDLLGNAVWTVAFALGGYGFGAALGHVVASVHSWTPWIALAAVLTTAALIYRHRSAAQAHLSRILERGGRLMAPPSIGTKHSLPEFAGH